MVANCCRSYLIVKGVSVSVAEAAFNILVYSWAPLRNKFPFIKCCFSFHNICVFLQPGLISVESLAHMSGARMSCTTRCFFPRSRTQSSDVSAASDIIISRRVFRAQSKSCMHNEHRQRRVICQTDLHKTPGDSYYDPADSDLPQEERRSSSGLHRGCRLQEAWLENFLMVVWFWLLRRDRHVYCIIFPYHHVISVYI